MNVPALIEKMLVLFFAMAAGFVCGKRGWLDDAGNRTISMLVVMLTNPMLALSSVMGKERLMSKSRKDIKMTIFRCFQHFLFRNQYSLLLLFPLFPSAPFAVWVSVWVKPENPAQKLHRSNQRIAGLKQVHFKL